MCAVLARRASMPAMPDAVSSSAQASSARLFALEVREGGREACVCAAKSSREILARKSVVAAPN